MVAVTRAVPRFLPTLTEVVLPSMAVEKVVQVPPPPVDPQAILARVQGDLDLVLQTHLEAAVANAMVAQVASIAARIRAEIEPLVRQAVANAVSAELDSITPE